MLDMVLRNRFLEILHNNKNLNHLTEEQKKNITSKIMKDMEGSNIFSFAEVQEDEDWDLIEQAADAIWSGGTQNDIHKAVENLRVSYGVKTKVKYGPIDPLERVKTKRRELSLIPELNIVLDDEEGEKQTIGEIIIVRYGRNLLHEAVAMRDIGLVKKYAKEQKYRDGDDNNGCTPLEMAIYEDFTGAIEILKLVKDAREVKDEIIRKKRKSSRVKKKIKKKKKKFKE